MKKLSSLQRPLVVFSTHNAISRRTVVEFYFLNDPKIFIFSDPWSIFSVSSEILKTILRATSDGLIFHFHPDLGFNANHCEISMFHQSKNFKYQRPLFDIFVVRKNLKNGVVSDP